MVYVDEDGKDLEDYKTEFWADLFADDETMGWFWRNILSMCRALHSGIKGSNYEYKLTWSGTKPTSGFYIENLFYTISDRLNTASDYAIGAFKLMNKAISGISGVVLFDGDSSLFDIPLPHDSYQNEDMAYITGFFYKFHEAGSWVEGEIVQNGNVFVSHPVDGKRVYDTGSEYIWNYKTTDPDVDCNSCMSLYTMLGKQIAEEFGADRGIDTTINWKYKTNEATPRTLKGDHAWWVDNGWPEGRKYRLRSDLLVQDAPPFIIAGLIIWLLRKFGVGGKIILALLKLITAIEGNDDIGDILTGLDSLSTDGSAFLGLKEIMSKPGRRYG